MLRRALPSAPALGTISAAVRVFGLRNCRYLGDANTRLQHLATAIALNLARVDACYAVVPARRFEDPPSRRFPEAVAWATLPSNVDRWDVHLGNVWLFSPRCL